MGRGLTENSLCLPGESDIVQADRESPHGECEVPLQTGSKIFVKIDIGLTVNLFQGPVIPLYLGADVFSSTDIRTENHPRYHARFAKRGLATKIHFSSGKIEPQRHHTVT